MDQVHPTALRGFDSYEIRLGDELRGQRATLGKSLLDVQRDLRIKAAYIDAIENCDASVVPNKGFVPGYVRAYARYLGMPADEVYARFCAESGFIGQTTAASRPGAAPRGGFRLGAGAVSRGNAPRDPALARSHFASPVGRARPVGLGVSLSDLASVAVLAALIGGLGWGGWKLVEDIQRVDFAPAEDAPEMAEAPANVALPGLAVRAAPSQWPGYAEAGDGAREKALAELYAPREPAPPEITLRDGPIAAIDPERSGLYGDPEAAARRQVAQAPRVPRPGPAEPEPNTLLREAPSLARMTADSLPGASLEEAAPTEPLRVAAADPTAELVAGLAARERAEDAAPLTRPGATGVWLVAADPAWVQVKARDGSILMQRIMERGERWQVPADAPRPELRAGNAGGVYLESDGVLRGPLGRAGAVVKRIPLDAPTVAADWPVAPRARVAVD